MGEREEGTLGEKAFFRAIDGGRTRGEPRRARERAKERRVAGGRRAAGGSSGRARVEAVESVDSLAKT